MTGKVKLTQEQFNWLERYKSDEEIDYAIDIQLHRKRPDSPVVDWKPSEVARAFYNGYEVEPAYKVGDWVHIVSNVHRTKGETRKITKVEKSCAVGKDVYYSLDGRGVYYKSYIRQATPEEIKVEKERWKWMKIGRGVGEFRDKDVLVIRDLGVRMVSEYYSGLPSDDLISIECAKGFYNDDPRIRFYLAESAVRFEDGDSDA